MLAFHDLNEAPWSDICEPGTVEGFESSEWSDSQDGNRQRQFVQLLNRTLRSQLAPNVRYWPKEDCYAFVGFLEEGKKRRSYESLKRRSPISIVSKFQRTTPDGRTFEWLRHLAFRGQFRRFDGLWYLEITPTYRFTQDGYWLYRFHEDALKGIKRIEGNRSVLSAVLFWADYLHPSNDFFSRKDLPLVFGNLPVFDIDVGINDSQWSERDPNAPLDEPAGKARILSPNVELTEKVMNIDFIDEPDLEFGGGGHHVDVRFGIMQHGPLDRGAPTSPAQLRVGIVGSEETMRGCRSG